ERMRRMGWTAELEVVPVRRGRVRRLQLVVQPEFDADYSDVIGGYGCGLDVVLTVHVGCYGYRGGLSVAGVGWRVGRRTATQCRHECRDVGARVCPVRGASFELRSRG